MELRRLTTTPNATALFRLLTNSANLDDYSESTGVSAAIDAAVEKADRFVDEAEQLTGSEAELAPDLHQGLSGLSNRLLNDPALWGWLAIGPFARFATYRWFDRGQLPGTVELSDAQLRRFITRPTLNGFARHAVARIYWGAKTLYTDDEEYDLVDVVLGNQDFYQNLFERLLGLYPPAARACARVLRDGTEKQRRQTIINLNLVFSTVAAEYLDDVQLEALVSDLYHGVTNKQ